MEDRGHPVDQFLAPHRLLALGLQHVLVMYAGAVAVPLIIGRALKLPPEQVALLISADLFACGIATLIQSIGLPKVGIRLPVMMGVTFASVSPMLAMANSPDVGILGIYGAVIVAGIFAFLVAPLVSRLLAFFPPVVTGTIILVIGISLMRIGINWAGGGLPTFAPKMLEGTLALPINPAYGALDGMGIALFVLLLILAITKWTTGFISNIAVLIGIVVGCLIASMFGMMSFAKVAAAPWFALVLPFQFGVPTLQIIPALTMCLVLIVVMIESTGMFLALGEMTDRKIDRAALTAGLRADGLGTIIGGVFNTFPYTSFSQNVGLVGVTGVRSRWVTATGGLIMLALGLCPKLSALAEAVPQTVLGGAGIVMFGMVAATGARILSGVDFKANRNNLFIVAISVGVGMITLVAPNFFNQLPAVLKPLLDSGILLAAIAAVLLNAFYNGFGSQVEADAAVEAAKGSEHA
ncbi:MAG: nucleobase:cation symporter-2 family protein [Ancalomicrobiaceae bacterium]|nr:nucleobase:cation symporter-2 family protein [Ancalomicrobiaceae bacterium]